MPYPLLIPQKPPMVMVDELLACSEAGASTCLAIRPGNLFVMDGFLREPGLIENIAQTAAAQAGYLCHLRNVPAPIGFIASVDKLEIKDLPAVSTIIETEIRVVNQIFNVTIVAGTVRCGMHELARCEMKIFLQP